MGSLLISDLSTFSLTVQNDAHNNGQSHASGDTLENDYSRHITANFAASVQNRATQLGSNLTSTQVVNRAVAMTCGGCHEPSAFGLTVANSVGPGQSWPGTLGFTHVSEFASSSQK
jgi:cytochrome c553